MEEIDLRNLMNKRGTGYRCLVEAVKDHDTAPGDPLTLKALRGARGIGYDFWQ